MNKKKNIFREGGIAAIVVMLCTGLLIPTINATKPTGADDDWDYWTNSPHMILNATGNVSIGAGISPVAKLQVGDGAALFNGTTGGTPISGAGTRLMWIPAKSAFRAGYATGNEWDDFCIGTYSVAMGYGNKASGNYATAIGGGTTASGGWSIAMGSGTTASGNYATAMGNTITVSGENSVGIGLNSTSYTVPDSNVFSVMGGFVGFGTTSPQAPLDVRSGHNTLFRVIGSTTTADPSFWIESTNAPQAWRFAVQRNSGWFIFTDNTNSKYPFVIIPNTPSYSQRFYPTKVIFNDNQNNYDFIIKSTGNAHMFFVDANDDRIGIGTNNPAAELDVDGTTMTNILQLDQLSSAPGSPADGMIVYADGSSWNPGSGEGIYGYYNSNWHHLG